jgi:hypothetical protein
LSLCATGFDIPQEKTTKKASTIPYTKAMHQIHLFTQHFNGKQVTSHHNEAQAKSKVQLTNEQSVTH